MTAANTVEAQALATVQQHDQVVAPIEAQILAFRVTNAEEAQQAADVDKWLGEGEKQLETTRKFLKAPALETGRRIDQTFNPAIKRRQKLRAHLRNEILSWQATERAAQAAALRDATSPAEVAQAVAVIVQTPEGLGSRDDWDFEIVDRSLIPASYWVLDEDRIRREAKAAKDKLAIPGVRPVRKEGLVRR